MKMEATVRPAPKPLRKGNARAGASPTTLHQKTELWLKQYLASGRIAVGDKLPPELELCESLKVSRNTLRMALTGLEREGYVVRKKRVGTVVARTNAPSRFNLDMSSLETVRDYLRRTVFGDRVQGRTQMPPELQSASGVISDMEWLTISGVRREIGGQKSVAGVEIYIDRNYATDADAYGKSTTFLSEVIEPRRPDTISHINICIQPFGVPVQWASSFDTVEGTPTLRLIEVVRKSDGSPLEIFSIVFAPSVQISFALLPDVRQPGHEAR